MLERAGKSTLRSAHQLFAAQDLTPWASPRCREQRCPYTKDLPREEKIQSNLRVKNSCHLRHKLEKKKKTDVSYSEWKYPVDQNLGSATSKQGNAEVSNIYIKLIILYWFYIFVQKKKKTVVKSLKGKGVLQISDSASCKTRKPNDSVISMRLES